MKRLLILVLACAILLLPSLASAASSTITDEVSGVSFSVPDGWKEDGLASANEGINYSFSPTGKTMTEIMFVSMDLVPLIESDPDLKSQYANKSREEIDEAFMSEADVRSSVGNDRVLSLEKKRFNMADMYIILTEHEASVGGLTYTRKMASAMFTHNGYMFSIQFYSFDDFDGYYVDFLSVLESMRDGSESNTSSYFDSPTNFSDIMVFESESVSDDRIDASYKTEYGITFGMTPQEVQDIEGQNGNEHTGTWENADSYQLYYSNDVHFYSLRCTRMQYDFDVVNRLLFQVYYVSSGGVADYSYAKSLITSMYGAAENNPNNTGNYSILYDQIGDNHIDESHWLISGEKSLGIDLWYNDYGTVFVLFFDAENPASFGNLPKQYSDETGITFSYPSGSWDALDMSILGDLTPAKISFTLRGDTQSSIQYMRMDLWENLKQNFEPLGFNREDLDSDFLDRDAVQLLMQPIIPKNLREITYNSLKFQVFEYETDNDGKSDVVYFCTMAITMKDGCAHLFQLSSVSKHDELIPAFENFLATVSFGDGVVSLKEEISTESGKANKMVVLNTSNIEQYFEIELTGKSFEGAKLTVAYRIAPKEKEYSAGKESSNDITIRLIVYAFDKEGSTEPIKEKGYTVILKKDNGYSASGNIEVLLPTSTLETVYWNHEIGNCSGAISVLQ